MTDTATITLPADTAAETLAAVTASLHGGPPPRRSLLERQRELAERAAGLDAGIDGCRWQLGGLASEAKKDQLPDWAEIIGQAISRKPRTVREYALTYEFRSALGTAIDLKFSFYARALRAIDQVPADKIIELMQTAKAEGATLEAFGALLDSLKAKPADDAAKRWRKWRDKLSEDADHMPELAVELVAPLREAARLLEVAAQKWDLLRANAEQAEQPGKDDDEHSPQPATLGGPMERDLLGALSEVFAEVNAKDPSMEAKLYHHGRLVAGG